LTEDGIQKAVDCGLKSEDSKLRGREDWIFEVGSRSCRRPIDYDYGEARMRNSRQTQMTAQDRGFQFIIVSNILYNKELNRNKNQKI
jgi:hypothetical protein